MKRTIKLLITLLLVSVVSTDIRASENLQATIYGGLYLNSDTQAWQIEPSIAYHFNDYFGAGIGLEFTSQYNRPSRQTVIDNHEAELTEPNIAWAIFKPSIIVKSPNLLNSNSDYRLWVQAEPGVSLACPLHNSVTYALKEFNGNVGHSIDYRRIANSDLKWIYWHTRATVNFAIDRVVIGIGYSISNFDYYSCRRNITLPNGAKFKVPGKELSHCLVASIGFKF